MPGNLESSQLPTSKSDSTGGSRFGSKIEYPGGKYRAFRASLYKILTEMGYDAPREVNAHAMEGHQRSLGAGASFHGQHLGVHSSGARRLAAYHDDRRRPTVTEVVLAINARYRGPKGTTAGRSRLWWRDNDEPNGRSVRWWKIGWLIRGSER